MANPSVPVATLAKLFNLTERRVQHLSRDNVIPKAEKGRYDLIACVQGYIKYLQDRATGRGDIEPQDTYAERARLLKAQADKTELEVKAMNGQLLATEQVELLWSGLVASFRSRLLALPVRCAQMVMSLKTYTEIEGCLRAQVFEALSELSRYDPEQQQSHIDLEESGEPGGTATVAPDQPVGGSLPLFEQ
ncbi:MAG: protoporphyrinogen oxidase [Pseudomonadota bacterium]|nr:protoporphyrinogen oxidase [Pseudomonadota bacterium]